MHSCKTHLTIKTQDSSLKEQLVALFKRLNKVSHQDLSDAIQSILEDLDGQFKPKDLLKSLKEAVSHDLSFQQIEFKQKDASLEIILNSNDIPEVFMELILPLLGQNPSVLSLKATSYTESSETHFELVDGEVSVDYDAEGI